MCQHLLMQFTKYYVTDKTGGESYQLANRRVCQPEMPSVCRMADVERQSFEFISIENIIIKLKAKILR